MTEERLVRILVCVYAIYILLVMMQRPVLDFVLLFITIFLMMTILSDILDFYNKKQEN